jgi:hypothetical protein
MCYVVLSTSHDVSLKRTSGVKGRVCNTTILYWEEIGNPNRVGG